ncbi:MAG: hypothetical protein HQK53_18265, partial [Oligoflexia bacterium]|nr:hypothetical protein [Oligoflexia bacterium]
MRSKLANNRDITCGITRSITHDFARNFLRVRPILSIAISIIFVAGTIRSTYGYSAKLPIWATKQSAAKLCFISQDGNYTYYQRRPSTLMLSSKYSTKAVLTAPTDGNFTLLASPSRKKIIIELDPFYFFSNENSYSFLYVLDFGGTTPTAIGQGISPKMHLNDNWVSYYEPQKKTIHFQSLNMKEFSSKFNISISSATNPYFVPEVIMYDEQNVLYTDLNNQGYSGIFLLVRNTKKNVLLYKNKGPGIKIEMCLNGSNLYIGKFAYPHIKGASTNTTS